MRITDIIVDAAIGACIKVATAIIVAGYVGLVCMVVLRVPVVNPVMR